MDTEPIDRKPTPQLSYTEAKGLLREAKAKTFTVEDTIALVRDCDLQNPRTVIDLYSAKFVDAQIEGALPTQITPLDNLTEIPYSEAFERMSKNAQTAIMRKMSRIQLSEYPRVFGTHHTQPDTGAVWYDVELDNNSFKGQGAQRFLQSFLDFTDGKATEAFRIIQAGVTEGEATPRKLETRRSVLYTLFTSPEASNNPALAKLAFNAYALVGGTSPQSTRFELLLDEDFGKVTNPIKTEIMKYLSDTLSKGKIPSEKLHFLQRFLDRNDALYRLVKKTIPDSPFAAAFEQTRASLKLQQIALRNSDGMASARDMLGLFTENPGYLTLVSTAELEALRDAASDHGDAMRLDQLVKVRHAQNAGKKLFPTEVDTTSQES